MANVIIVGGGIIGLCSAYYLQKEGYAVTVIDRGDITDGCSFGNMGFMSPSHFIPLASPGIISEGLKHMLSSSSPFFIKPRLNIELLQWGYHFWKNCNNATVNRNAPHLDAILQFSRHLANELKDELGDHFEMEEIGCMMMCKEKQTLDHEFHLADDAEKFGLKVQRLDKTKVQQHEPNVELSVSGAVLYKDDCHFNPGKLMVTLKENLVTKGVKFLLERSVTGFEITNSRVTSVITGKDSIPCEELIIAGGSWLPDLAKMLKRKLLLQAGKGYSYTYPFVEKNIRYPAILVDGRCAITPWGNKLRIGGTMELSGINSKVLIKRMEGIYRSAKSFYPGLKIAAPPKDKIWTGLRPVTPDGLPYIGRPDGYTNVVFAGGHAMLGISQGTGTGKLVSEIIAQKKCSVDITAFNPNRYS